MIQSAFFGVLASLACIGNVVAHEWLPVPRPEIKAWPHSPGGTFPVSPHRVKSCYVKASNNGGDDAASILHAFHTCNNGGTVVLAANYTIASPLDLTFLKHVDVAITGTINFAPDLSYWTEHSFKYTYQDATAFWRFGGEDVNIFGHGVGLINGNGQPWYDAAATNTSLLRPVLFLVDGLRGGSVTGLRMIYPPSWFNLIANSTDIIVSDLDLQAVSKNSNLAKNTDGWDIYRSDSVVLQNSVINNGDDCVSLKPNSTNIVVQGLHCNGSHGISVGSLGQYAKEFDIVENVYVYNISMSNASDGARIKVWPGQYTAFQDNLNGGGGSGYVKNVTYDGLFNTNNDWAIELTQCYGQKNLTLCNEFPSNMFISDVVFKNMWGTTSKRYDPKVGTLVCSDALKCSNIQAHNISVSPPSGKIATWVCTNMNNSRLDINCGK
ncbi:murein transglycosylase [Fusarium oxysporum f. sp. raphani 54005]|uniref:galacturonan 1,4-alpha-galacturonidase n=1 Tax=Fusarium oxysporum f. sp. raphani 54005 TaxID=1089458 RepID=X0BNG5_FUSOX|nr:murein transglycosylase [Fusarium oxysporum f. sp. raphani 54005]